MQPTGVNCRMLRQTALYADMRVTPGTLYRQLLRTQTNQKQPELLPTGGPKLAGGDDCFRTPNIQQSLPG